ncbi:MAG TPA: hypothetical protein VJU61_08905 [Polyangiaceae bacterium]|nr:hypothetical protein [Polyangiaceae bacterium]
MTISSSDEALWERRERRSDDLSHRLGGADVLLGHLECAVPGALLNLQRLVAADGHPGETGAAQVVEAQALAGVVGGEERLARDVRELQVFAQVGGPPFLLAHIHDRALPFRFGVHCTEQGEQLWLDSEAAHSLVACLGLLDAPCSAVVGTPHGDDAVLDVDVGPGQRFQLAAAEEQVCHESVEAADLERQDLAG